MEQILKKGNIKNDEVLRLEVSFNRSLAFYSHDDLQIMINDLNAITD